MTGKEPVITAVTSSDRHAQLARTAALLQDVFGGDRYTNDYIEWLYEAATEGREISCDIEEQDILLAHYSVVPQTYHSASADLRMALSLNTAVAESERGKGVFSELAKRTFQKAQQDHKISAIIGVANANSTPGFLGRLQFALLGPLPVQAGMAVPIRFGGTHSHMVTPAFLRSDAFWQIADSLDYAPGTGWSQVWDSSKLAWRLGSPLGGYYMHVSEQAMMVSCGVRHHGLPIAVVQKIFTRKGAAYTSTGSLLSAACAAHRTIFYLYAGFNTRAAVKGLPIPTRLRPSPLNLIYLPLTKEAPAPEKFQMDCFEFLDFDAY